MSHVGHVRRMEDHLFLRPSPTGQSPAHMCMKRSVPPCAEAVYADLVKPKEEAVIADVCCYSAATHARSFEPGAWFVSPTARRTRWRGARAELDLRRCSSSRGPSSLLCSGWCRAARSCLPFGFQAIKQRQTSCPLEDQLAQAEFPPVSVL